MSRQREKILLGATESNTLVFANIELTNRNGYPEFSASFDEVNPFIASDEYLSQRAESYVDSMSDEEKYRLCESYDCKPSELANEFIHSQLISYGVEGLEDISLYPESFDIGLNDDIYFCSGSCGQHDCRKTLEDGIIINNDSFHAIHEAWDNYHLKEMPQNQWNELVSAINSFYSDFDEEVWIKNWLTTKVFYNVLQTN